MISKEEIEELKSLLFKDQLTQHGKRKLIEYIEQLENKVREVETQRNELATELSENEDDKQKLIDKLEEKQEKVKDKRSKLGFKTYMKREHMIREDCELLGKQKAYNEILSIVKGEKQ